MEHDFLALYPAKAIEYLLAIGFLISFVAFWRYVNGPAEPAALPAWKALGLDFRLPSWVLLHPGHAWARAERPFATVGLDDFGSRLMGRVGSIHVPPAGSELRQGERAFSLERNGKSVDVLAPLDGTVVESNPRLLAKPELLESDPYGEGWVLKIRPSPAGEGFGRLLSGSSAAKFLKESFEALLQQASPALGPVAHDGGLPLSGLATALDPEHWDDLVRKHFTTHA